MIAAGAANSTKPRATNANTFFMATSRSLGDNHPARTGWVLSDRHHVLELFHPKLGSVKACRRTLCLFTKCPSLPINPPWSQAAGDALSPSPFYGLEPDYSRLSCAVVDNNWTPREPVMPVHG